MQFEVSTRFEILEGLAEETVVVVYATDKFSAVDEVKWSAVRPFGLEIINFEDTVGCRPDVSYMLASVSVFCVEREISPLRLYWAEIDSCPAVIRVTFMI